MAKYCTKCGAKISEDMVFCTHCGKKLIKKQPVGETQPAQEAEAAEQAEAPKEQAAAEEATPPKKKKRGKFRFPWQKKEQPEEEAEAAQAQPQSEKSEAEQIAETAAGEPDGQEAEDASAGQAEEAQEQPSEEKEEAQGNEKGKKDKKGKKGETEEKPKKKRKVLIIVIVVVLVVVVGGGLFVLDALAYQKEQQEKALLEEQEAQNGESPAADQVQEEEEQAQPTEDPAAGMPTHEGNDVLWQQKAQVDGELGASDGLLNIVDVAFEQYLQNNIAVGYDVEGTARAVLLADLGGAQKKNSVLGVRLGTAEQTATDTLQSKDIIYITETNEKDGRKVLVYKREQGPALTVLVHVQDGIVFAVVAYEQEVYEGTNAARRFFDAEYIYELQPAGADAVPQQTGGGNEAGAAPQPNEEAPAE